MNAPTNGGADMQPPEHDSDPVPLVVHDDTHAMFRAFGRIETHLKELRQDHRCMAIELKQHMAGEELKFKGLETGQQEIKTAARTAVWVISAVAATATFVVWLLQNVRLKG